MNFLHINSISEKSWEGLQDIIIIEKRITKKNTKNNLKARVSGARITPREARFKIEWIPRF